MYLILLDIFVNDSEFCYYQSGQTINIYLPFNETFKGQKCVLLWHENVYLKDSSVSRSRQSEA